MPQILQLPPLQPSNGLFGIRVLIWPTLQLLGYFYAIWLFHLSKQIFMEFICRILKINCQKISNSVAVQHAKSFTLSMWKSLIINDVVWNHFNGLLRIMYIFVMIRIVIRLLYCMNSRISQCGWTGEVSICRRIYKITSCDSANALGGTIFYRNVIDSATNGSGGCTGGNFIFSSVKYCITTDYRYSGIIWYSRNFYIARKCATFPFEDIFSCRREPKLLEGLSFASFHYIT